MIKQILQVLAAWIVALAILGVLAMIHNKDAQAEPVSQNKLDEWNRRVNRPVSAPRPAPQEPVVCK